MAPGQLWLLDRTTPGHRTAPSRSRGGNLVRHQEAADERLPASPPAVESTVGTGSIFAIGCAILALMVIFAGIAIFFLA